MNFTGGLGSGRAAAQFDKANTTFADITGVPVNVQAGVTYFFWGYFPCTFDAVGSGKFQITGTATATAIINNWRSYNNATAANITFAQQAALTTAFNVAAGATDVLVLLDGTITVNAGGTFAVQFAQLVANGTSSVLRGGRFVIMATT